LFSPTLTLPTVVDLHRNLHLSREAFKPPTRTTNPIQEETMQITPKELLAENGYSSADEELAEYSQLDDLYPMQRGPRSRAGRTLSTWHPALAASPRADLRLKENSHETKV
jgi:hypothetical protein